MRVLRGGTVTDDEYRTAFVKQAADVIDADTTWKDLANELDIEEYRYHDDYYAKPNATPKPFAPMFLSVLWASVEGIPPSSIGKSLENQPRIAEAFGFDADNIPNDSTFYRATKDRFGELEGRLDRGAKQIRRIAADRGSPIGYPLGTSKPNDDESEDSTPSERTIQRMVRSNGRKVLKELQSTVYSVLWLPRPEEGIYEEFAFYDMEAIGTINQNAANNAGQTYGDLRNPDPDYDDPFYEDGPSGETFLEAIKELSVDEIAEMMNFALAKSYNRAKPRLRELEDFDTFVTLAIDITYVAYRGETEGLEWLQGAPDDKDYKWCHKFATATIVGQNTHFIVGVVPLGSTEYADTDAYPGEDKSYRAGNVVRRLINTAKQHTNIRMVYADREFASADAMFALENEYDTKYVIPVPENERIEILLDEVPDNKVYVEHDYAIYSTVKDKTTNTRVTTNLVVLPPDEDDDTHEDGEQQVFFTNTEVDDEISLDRRLTKQKIERYRDRGAIEVSYGKIKEAAAWTTSKEFEIRWFHFAFACVVYNFWLLVDFITQDRIGVIETRSKPRITLSRFLNWLSQELSTLI